jgi:hypothetical protein
MPGGAAGRTFPSAAGFHTAELFFTDDSGLWFFPTRDAGALVDPATEQVTPELMVERHRGRLRKLSDERLFLPAAEPYLEGHDTWCVNVPGSLLEGFFLEIYTARAHNDGTVAQFIQEVLAFPHKQTTQDLQAYLDAFVEAHQPFQEVLRSGTPASTPSGARSRRGPEIHRAASLTGVLAIVQRCRSGCQRPRRAGQVQPGGSRQASTSLSCRMWSFAPPATGPAGRAPAATENVRGWPPPSAGRRPGDLGAWPVPASVRQWSVTHGG